MAQYVCTYIYTGIKLKGSDSSDDVFGDDSEESIGMKDSSVNIRDNLMKREETVTAPSLPPSTQVNHTPYTPTTVQQPPLRYTVLSLHVYIHVCTCL